MSNTSFFISLSRGFSGLINKSSFLFALSVCSTGDTLYLLGKSSHGIPLGIVLSFVFYLSARPIQHLPHVFFSQQVNIDYFSYHSAERISTLVIIILSLLASILVSSIAPTILSLRGLAYPYTSIWSRSRLFTIRCGSNKMQKDDNIDTSTTLQQSTDGIHSLLREIESLWKQIFCLLSITVL